MDNNKLSEKIKYFSQATSISIDSFLLYPNLGKFLPEWNYRKAEYIKHHFEAIKTHKRKNEKVFKRGSLVFVDFGVNVGSELSGNHYAIVLNNKDNSRSNSLTVIPITSHEHGKFTIPLLKPIAFVAIKEYQKILNELNTYLHAGMYVTGIDYHMNTTYWPNKTEKELRKTYLAYVKQHKLSADILHEPENLIKISTDAKHIATATSQVTRFTKKSYALFSDIQTISKDRIMRVRYEPVVRVSGLTLSMIDQKIKENFTALE